MSENTLKKQRYQSHGNKRPTFPLHRRPAESAVLATVDDEANHINRNYLNLDQIPQSHSHNSTSRYDTDPLRLFSRSNQSFHETFYTTTKGQLTQYPFDSSNLLQHPLHDPLYTSASGDQPRLPSPSSTSSPTTSPNTVLNHQTIVPPPQRVIYAHAHDTQDPHAEVNSHCYTPGPVQTTPLEATDDLSMIQKGLTTILPSHQSPEYPKPPIMTLSTFDGLYDPAMQGSSNLLGFTAAITSSIGPVAEGCFRYAKTSPTQVTAEPLNTVTPISAHSANDIPQFQTSSFGFGAWPYQESHFPDGTHQVDQGTYSHTHPQMLPLPHSPSNPAAPSTFPSGNKTFQYMPPGENRHEIDQSLRPYPDLHASTIAEYAPQSISGSSQQPSTRGGNPTADIHAQTSVSSLSLNWGIDQNLPKSPLHALRTPAATYNAPADPSSSALAGVNQSEDSSYIPLSECFRNPGQNRLRQRLDQCLGSQWLRDNEEEPTEKDPMAGHKERSILLGFTSRSGRAAAFSCMFDGCGRKFDRKDRAIIHIRFRHLGHKPFPCGGRCGDRRCIERFACDPYRQSHINKAKSACENCGRLLYRKNMSRHRFKCQTPSDLTGEHHS